jgi:hypothetical protein
LSAGCGELSGVAVSDVGVPASGFPCELGDTVGTTVLADAAPVCDTQLHGCVCDMRVVPGGEPARVDTGAGLLARHLEEPPRIPVGVAECELCDLFCYQVEGAGFTVPAGGAQVVVAASSECCKPRRPLLRPVECRAPEPEPAFAGRKVAQVWEECSGDGCGAAVSPVATASDSAACTAARTAGRSGRASMTRSLRWLHRYLPQSATSFFQAAIILVPARGDRTLAWPARWASGMTAAAGRSLARDRVEALTV